MCDATKKLYLYYKFVASRTNIVSFVEKNIINIIIKKLYFITNKTLKNTLFYDKINILNYY
ncbi:hypothetical protein RIVM261_086210 [Rivularia sp. IAM M-261]|nr:hypothetical protein RIVM261_086210 [Rivularia sp. IAM M-261]